MNFQMCLNGTFTPTLTLPRQGGGDVFCILQEALRSDVLVKREVLMPRIITALCIFYFLSTGVSCAATAAVNVSATVLSINQCKFNTGESTLDLGVLDPESPIDRTLTTSMVFRCAGSDASTAFAINDDSDTVLPSDRKMKHSTVPDASIPYEVSFNKIPGEAQRNVEQTVMVSVRIKGKDYRDVYSGGYSDVVYISISP